jgi:hypothetical protein
MGRFGAGVALVVVASASAPVRAALVALEPGLPAALYTVAVVAALVAWWSRAVGRATVLGALRRTEVRCGRALERWGWALSVLLLMASLWAQWAMQPRSLASGFPAFAGHIPWGDAHGHFEGALRLLGEGRLNAFSERRPMNATWLAVRLALFGGRLDAAIVAQVVILATAAWLAARVVALRYGLWAGLGFFGLMLGLSRDHVVAVLTEPLGATLACLALTFLLPGRGSMRLGPLVAGLMALDAALRARPGPQLLLPALALWGVWNLRGQRRVAAAAVASVMGLGALHSGVLNRFYGSGEASSTSYPAFTLYGLAHDANYERAYADFGDELSRGATEEEVARRAYAQALAAIREDPRPLLRALSGNLARFVTKLPLNLTPLVSPRTFFASGEARAEASEAERRVDRAAGGALLLVSVAAFVLVLRRGPSWVVGFWLAVAAGIAGSACFVFGDTGFRALAAAYPFFAVAFSLGLARRPGGRPLGLPNRERVQAARRMALGMTLGLLAVCVVGPALARRVHPGPAAGFVEGLTPGRDAVVALRDCPSVIVANRGIPDAGAPVVERRRFERLLEVAGIEPPPEITFAAVPYALLSCYDFVSHQQRVLVAPHRFPETSGRFVQVQIRDVDAQPGVVEVVGWSPPRP